MGYCDELTDLQRQQMKAMETSVNGDVSNRIGSPVNRNAHILREIKDVQSRIVKYDKKLDKPFLKRDKRKLKELNKERANEKERYSLHNKLHRRITNHILKLTAASGFAVDPSDYLLVIDSMSRKLFNMPLVNMNFTHPNTIRTFDNLLGKWIKKTTENKKLNVFNKSFQDIWKMIATKDVSGLGFKVAEMAATLPDSTWNSAFEFLDKHEDAIIGLEQNIDDWASSADNYSSVVFKPHEKTRKDGKGSITLEDFTTLTPKKQLQRVKEDYNNLLQDLMDGRVRKVVPKVIPMNPDEYKEWQRTDDGEAVGQYLKWGEMHRFHNIDSKDGNRYTYMMVYQGEGGVDGEVFNAYLVSKSSKNEEDKWVRTGTYAPGVANNYPGYGEDTIVSSGLREGYYEASVSEPFHYPMRTQKGAPIEGTNLTSYYNFNRMDIQPNEDIMSKKKYSTVGRNSKTMWEALLQERAVLKSMRNIMQANIKGHEKELNIWVKNAKVNFVNNMGRTPAEAQELVDVLTTMNGVEANVWESPKTGYIFTGNSFMNMVTQLYSPNVYDIADGWDFIDKGESDLKQEIPKIEQDLALSQSVLVERGKELDAGVTDYTVDDVELLEHRNNVSYQEDQLEKAQQELSNFQQLREVDRPATPEEIKKQRLVRRMVHTKHRKPFTNAMLRDRTPAALTKYINTNFKAMHYNQLTLETLKALTIIKDPEVAQFLINRVKIATGSVDYDANFFGKDISNEQMSGVLNKVAKVFGKKGEWKPEDIHYIGTGLNMWASSNLLGMWAALNNNTQRMALIEEFGFRPFMRAWSDMNDRKFIGSELETAVKKTGVLDLINWFSDMMIGEERGTNPEFIKHKIKPNLAWAEVQMAKSKFIRQKTSVFDNMLKEIAGFGQVQIKHIKKMKEYTAEEEKLELKKKRGQLWDVMQARELNIMKKRLKLLNRGLTHEEINKLATYKLRYMKVLGDTDSRWTTFSGGEKDMRTQAAIIGFYVAEDMGLLDPEEEVGIPKYEQQAAINMARTSVYNTMFGMSIQWLPEMFGGIGKQLFQYKPYTYHEMIREARVVETFLAGNTSAIGGFRRIASAFFQQYGGKGTKYGDPKTDEFARRAVRFFEGRVPMTIFMNLMTWNPAFASAKGILNIFGRKVIPGLPARMTRSYSSPWVNIAMKLIMTGMYGLGISKRYRLKKHERWWDDMVYIFLPPMFSWMLQLHKGKRNLKPWVPMYDELIDPAVEIYDSYLD